jgi:hypothetical protein
MKARLTPKGKKGAKKGEEEDSDDSDDEEKGGKKPSFRVCARANCMRAPRAPLFSCLY